MKGKAILGIDGGGTYTRVAVTDIEGTLLSYVEWKGGAFKLKDAKANENVFNAIHAATTKANCELCDIVALTAGIAGYDRESDLEWVRELTNIDGLNCSQQHVSDFVIAHIGALLFKPGIISISGTGSVIFGITETGWQIRNHNFHHYAPTAARCLTYNCVYKIIAGEIDQTDSDLINSVLMHFKVKNLFDLIKLGSEGFEKDYRDRDRLFGDFAPVITSAALNGSHLAVDICKQAAVDIVTGIKLVGACFESDAILAALIGGVANSTFISNAVKNILSEEDNTRYILAKPALPAVLGAVIMAMRLDSIEVNERIQDNLFKGAGIILTSNCLL